MCLTLFYHLFIPDSKDMYPLSSKTQLVTFFKLLLTEYSKEIDLLSFYSYTHIYQSLIN
ncbi:hypothetical protein FM106_32195 [Brachybacterium faecium]|nr:hypothetical protein FM106_32195 [Brachybacterium faecium]